MITFKLELSETAHFFYSRLFDQKNRCYMQFQLDNPVENLLAPLQKILNENSHIDKSNQVKAIETLMIDLLKPPISLENKVTIFNHVSKLNYESYRLICRNFSLYGLVNYIFDSENTQTRLDRCVWIAKQGDWGMTCLVPHFKNVLNDLTIEQRIEFYKQMASVRGEWAIIALMNNFAKLGLSETTMEQRIDLCAHFVSLGGKIAVSKYFEKTEILKAISSYTNPTDRWQQCDRIASKGTWAIEILIKHQKLIGLLSPIFKLETAENRLEDSLQIISQYPWMARVLLKNLAELNIIETSLQKRIELHQSLVYEDNQETYDSVEKLGLLAAIASTVDLNARVKLCKYIAASSSIAALAIATHFSLFKFELLEPSEFLSLVQHLIHLNPSSHIYLLVYLKTAELPSDTRRRAVIELLPTTHLALNDFYHADLKPIKSALNLLFTDKGDFQSSEYQKKLENFHHFLDNHPKLLFLKITCLEFLEKYSDNEDLQIQAIETCAYAAALLYESLEDQLSIIESTKMIETIIKLRHPALKLPLLRQLKSTILNERPHLSLNTNSKREKAIEQPWSDLAWIFLCKLHSFGIEETEIHALYHKIKTARIFKEGSKTTDLMHLFLYLFEHERLLEKYKDQQSLCPLIATLQKLFSKKDSAALISDIQSLSNILICLGFESFFECIQSQSSFKDYFSQGLQKLLGITEFSEAEFSQKFQKSFEDPNQFKDPQLLYNYLRAMKRLPAIEKDAIYALLKRFVISVMEGNFHQLRYDTAKHPHLAKLFSIPGLKNLWMDGAAPQQLKERLEYQICEMDTPHSLMALSSDIQGSCLSVNGNPANNKCLIAYILHGELRPIVVINTENSKFVARALLRLMWDPIIGKPVLLQEKIYSNVPNLEFVNGAINEWAMQKAKKMNIPLVCAERTEQQIYPRNIEFLGGIAPFMYCDAYEEGGNRVIKGSFTLKNLKLKYWPALPGEMTHGI